MRRMTLSRRTALTAIATVAALAAGSGVGRLRASDHQDSPDVELNPSMDMTDVYAFPSGSAPTSRIVLVLNSWAFLTPAQATTIGFDNNLLYQFKIDNTGDAKEDRVIQVVFTGSGSSQQVHVYGPMAPPAPGAMNNVLTTAAPTLSGSINTNLGTAGGMQVFAGAREEPFFIDLEQFFHVLPDRKPSTGPLSLLSDVPQGTFRSAASAVDFPKGFNVLSIVIELNKADLVSGGNTKIGIWGTISR